MNSPASKIRITDIEAPRANLFARKLVRYIRIEGWPAVDVSVPAMAKIKSNIFFGSWE